jgi:hypothetical protein
LKGKLPARPEHCVRARPFARKRQEGRDLKSYNNTSSYEYPLMTP